MEFNNFMSGNKIKLLVLTRVHIFYDLNEYSIGSCQMKEINKPIQIMSGGCTVLSTLNFLGGRRSLRFVNGTHFQPSFTFRVRSPKPLVFVNKEFWSNVA